MQLAYIKSGLTVLSRFVTSIYGVFIILSVSVTSLFIMATPLGWGLDEQVHAPRAYQISEGNIYPDENPADDTSFGGMISDDFQEAFLYGWAQSNSVDRLRHPYARSDVVELSPQAPAYANQEIDGSEKYYDFGPAGPYSPIVYTPASLGIVVANALDLNVRQTGTLARIFQVIFYISSCVLSLYTVRNLKVKWLVFAIALLPSSLYQASVISADPVTTGIVLVYTALILSIFINQTKLSKRKTILLIVSTLLMALVKQNYALLALTTLFIPHQRFNRVKSAITTKLLSGIGWLVLFIASTVKGLSYSGSISQYRGELAEEISFSGQLLWMLSHPFEAVEMLIDSISIGAGEWYQSLFGTFGYTTITVPFMVVIVLTILIFILAMYSDAPQKRLYSWILLAAGLLSALSIIVVLYATFTQVGAETVAGVQGRYFIPVLIFIVFGTAKLLPLKLHSNEKAIKRIVVTALSISLIYTGVMYMRSMY